MFSLIQAEIDAMWNAVPLGVRAAILHAESRGCVVHRGEDVESCWIHEDRFEDRLLGIEIAVYNASDDIGVALVLAGFERIVVDVETYYGWGQTVDP